MIYLSENPFNDNFDIDAGSKLFRAWGYGGWNKNDRNSKWVNLTKDKKYYLRFVINNVGGEGQGQIGYIYNTSDNIKGIQTDRIWLPGAIRGETDQNPFMPKIENDPTLGIYWESDLRIKYPPNNFKLLKSLTTEDPAADLNKLLFDGDTSKSQSTNVVQQLPIQYNIDFGQEITFDRLYMPEGNKKINGDCTITCDGKQTYEGKFSDTITFGSAYYCRYVNLSIYSNSNGNFAGIVEIQPVLLKAATSRNIIPATHKDWRIQGNGVLSKEGLYYNGKGWKLQKDANLTLSIDLNETGGHFDVYLDGELHGSCNTSFIFDDIQKNRIIDTMFQQPLYSIRNLKNSSHHFVSMVVRTGNVGIAGILADGKMIQVIDPTPLPTPTPTPVPTPAIASSGDNLDVGSSNGKIIGITLGVVIPLVVIGAAIVGFFVFKHLKEKSLERSSDEDALLV